MKITIIAKVAVSVLVATVTLSCSGFLDEKLMTEPSDSEFLKEYKDFVSALNAAYSAMGKGDQQGTFGRGWIYMGEIGTDEVAATQKDLNNTERAQMEVYNTLTGANTVLQSIWQQAYMGINRANLVINSIEKMGDVPPSTYESIYGEARFLRGLFYFNMVRGFGGIPKKTEYSKPGDDLTIARSSVQEIYDLIIADFEAADRYCLETPVNLGQATKLSAQGMLSKVYLTIASYKRHNAVADENLKVGGLNSYDWVDDVEAYGKAHDYAAGVLEALGGGRNVIMEDFRHTFYPYENSKESLFEVQHAADMSNDQGGYLGAMYGPKGASEFGGGQNHLHIVYSGIMKNDAGQELMPRDNTRFNWTVCNFSYPSNLSAGWSEIIQAQDFNWTIGKFRCDANRSYPYYATPHNVPVLRSAEVCLIYAEAEAELNGVGTEAFRYLNVVRSRGGSGELTTLDELRNFSDNPSMLGYNPESDIEYFRLAILNERKWELLGEGHRWFDLVRMGIFLDVLKAVQLQNEAWAASSQNPIKNRAYPGSRKPSEFHIFRPIPTREMGLNSALVQNYGYK